MTAVAHLRSNETANRTMARTPAATKRAETSLTGSGNEKSRPSLPRARAEGRSVVTVCPDTCVSLPWIHSDPSILDHIHHLLQACTPPTRRTWRRSARPTTRIALEFVKEDADRDQALGEAVGGSLPSKSFRRDKPRSRCNPHCRLLLRERGGETGSSLSLPAQHQPQRQP